MVEYEDVRRWAIHWSQKWFLDAQGRDRFQVAGVSAGWATHIDAYDALLRHAATRWLDPPERTTSGLLATVKQMGLDRRARAMALAWLGPSPATATAHRRRPAFVVEVPTPSMLDPAAITVQALGGRASVAAADPRALRRLRSCCQPVALSLPSHRTRALLNSASKDVNRSLDLLRRDPPHISFQGRDVTMEVLRALGPLIARSMPWLAPERAALSAFIDAAQPSAIGLASDQHRIGRIAAGLGKEIALRVVVLQHGLPQMPIGLLPVVADQVATWSAASNEWFVRHGTPEARLTLTGNPRLDQLVTLDRARAQHEVEAQHGAIGDPRLLLALSPTAPDVNRNAVRLAVQAAELMPMASLVIKLHPGHGSWSFLRDFVRTSSARSRIRVLRATPLYPLLGWASVVLLHRSTVAIEALAAGSPVVIVDVPGSMSGADLELAALDAPRFRTAEAVRDWLRSNFDRASYFATRDSAIRYLAGPVDGQSAKRVASLLMPQPDGLADRAP